MADKGGERRGQTTSSRALNCAPKRRAYLEKTKITVFSLRISADFALSGQTKLKQNKRKEKKRKMLAIMKQKSKEIHQSPSDQSHQNTSRSAASSATALSTSRSLKSHSGNHQSHLLSGRHSSSGMSGWDDSSVHSHGTNFSQISYRTKYEPQKSIHEEISYVFHRPIKSSYSRGHEIPEPQSPHHSLSPPSLHSNTFDPTRHRPHTSGTKLPPCFSPIRPSDRSRQLFSRATSPVMLRHGRHIPVDMISVKYKYPLNNISYEKPSSLASNIQNASLPSCAENILEETRFQSIAPFTKRVPPPPPSPPLPLLTSLHLTRL
jgi:hypothetical protein